MKNGFEKFLLTVRARRSENLQELGSDENISSLQHPFGQLFFAAVGLPNHCWSWYSSEVAICKCHEVARNTSDDTQIQGTVVLVCFLSNNLSVTHTAGG